MSDTIRAHFVGVDEIRRDLDAVQLGLGRAVTQALRDNAAIVAGRTATLTPRGPGPRQRRDGVATDDALPHMADTMRGATEGGSLLVTSSHPAAALFEYAGQGTATISPRGGPITIHRRAMAHRAGEQLLPKLERDITARIDALTSAHGLT
jgi:hypothetical protein